MGKLCQEEVSACVCNVLRMKHVLCVIEDLLLCDCVCAVVVVFDIVCEVSQVMSKLCCFRWILTIIFIFSLI